MNFLMSLLAAAIAATHKPAKIKNLPLASHANGSCRKPSLSMYDGLMIAMNDAIRPLAKHNIEK